MYTYFKSNERCNPYKHAVWGTFFALPVIAASQLGSLPKLNEKNLMRVLLSAFSALTLYNICHTLDIRSWVNDKKKGQSIPLTSIKNTTIRDIRLTYEYEQGFGDYKYFALFGGVAASGAVSAVALALR